MIHRSASSTVQRTIRTIYHFLTLAISGKVSNYCMMQENALIANFIEGNKNSHLDPKENEEIFERHTT